MKTSMCCPKCRSKSLSTGELRGAGGFLSSMFDFATRRFKTITCNACGYTELYSDDTHVPA